MLTLYKLLTKLHLISGGKYRELAVNIIYKTQYKDVINSLGGIKEYEY
jgi:hypothetical protein